MEKNFSISQIEVDRQIEKYFSSCKLYSISISIDLVLLSGQNNNLNSLLYIKKLTPILPKSSEQ